MPTPPTLKSRLARAERELGERHVEAMLCRDVEEHVAKALRELNVVLEIDRDVRAKWAAGAAYDRDIEARLEALVASWAANTKLLAETVRRFVRHGFTVEGSAEFFRACRDARSMAAEFRRDAGRAARGGDRRSA